GVLGLGRRWQARYRPALAALRDRFVVRAVADPIAARTEEQAREMDCDANAGPIDMLENPGVEAVLLLDEAWYGRWTIEAACRVGKPVCCAAVGDVEGESNKLCRKVRERNLPVLMAMAHRLSPATRRLQELIANELGPPRVVVVNCQQRGHPFGSSGQ